MNRKKFFQHCRQARAKWAEPHGDRRQELVFIGTELDETKLRMKLEACLL